MLLIFHFSLPMGSFILLCSSHSVYKIFFQVYRGYSVQRLVCSRKTIKVVYRLLEKNIYFSHVNKTKDRKSSFSPCSDFFRLE